jgi:Plavaka transposase
MIAENDPETHGAMFAPVILGSDKTTVSVATGQNEYYPLYAGIGNAQNHVRRAHRNALALIGFLAIPKSMYCLFESAPAVSTKFESLKSKTADKQYQDSKEFRRFRRQLFHKSLTRILLPLKPFMTKPRVTRCGDGHFRRVIYGVGPYIADYPEQALLACIVSGWCPK